MIYAEFFKSETNQVYVDSMRFNDVTLIAQYAREIHSTYMRMKGDMNGYFTLAQFEQCVQEQVDRRNLQPWLFE